MQSNPHPQVSNFEPLTYRIKDACRVVGIGRSKLYELVAEGRLTIVKIGGRSVVRRTELQRLIDEGPKAA